MEMPIAKHKNKIIETIRNHQVTIITADTGAGKSTQVPQYLLEAGFEVIVTQPRRLAARTLAERVAFEQGSKLGGIIGFRTALDSCQSRETRCLFATDGLILVRELVRPRKPNVILVLDEVHEWNMNIEVLAAYTRKLMREHKEMKIVVMSATLDKQKISEYFDQAPVIQIPGRLHQIEDRKPGRSMIDDVVELLRQRRNILVFQPGKADIEDMKVDLGRMHIDAEVLPLHAELTPEEQARCFETYHRPKCIIATNIAQTSITIEDIDAVVDSGMEKRREVRNGVEGIILRPISTSDSKQRRGRAGRCRPGIYIDHCPHWDRPEFAKAEILCSLLDQTVLRLAKEGLDAEKLDFFHQPNREEIYRAKQSLKLIGCMDEKGSVTQRGKRVAKLPVSVKYGRMLVEAHDLGVVSDVLTIVSLLEVGGIIDRKGDWRSLCSHESESDLLAQLSLYRAAHQKDQDWLMKHGINVALLHKAREVRSRIVNEVREDMDIYATGRRQEVIRSVCAGLVEHVFRKEGNRYINGKGPARKLNQDSVLTSEAPWIVGVPIDHGVPGNVTRLITMATAIRPELLRKVAPHMLKKVSGLSPRYDYQEKCVVSTTRVYFGSHVLEEVMVQHPRHTKAETLQVEALHVRQWMVWKPPFDSVPLPVIEGDKPVEEIQSVAYGECPVARTPLMAYGTIVPDEDEITGQSFKKKWTRDPVEAKKWRDSSILHLEKLRRTRNPSPLQKDVASLQFRVLRLWMAQRYNPEIDLSLRNRLGEIYELLCSSSEEATKYIVEASELITRIESVLQGAERIKPPILKPTNKGREIKSLTEL